MDLDSLVGIENTLKCKTSYIFNEMKNKKYYIVGAFPNSNRKS